MSIVKEFNGLNGVSGISRGQLHGIAQRARKQEQFKIAERIEKILNSYPDQNFDISIDKPAFEEIPDYVRHTLPFEADPQEKFSGLNKAVTPDEIYQYITDLIINTIKKVGHLPWQREWEKTSLFNGWQALNFESKKGYRGINFFLTNFIVEATIDGPVLKPRDLTNPYFLTFNQIEKNGGELKKGSKGVRVVYFTKLYHYEGVGLDGKVLEFGSYNQKKFIAWLKKNRSKIKHIKSDMDFERLSNSYIPILKYYNVFAGEDINGINWGDLPKNDNADKPEKERIAIAEAIVDKMPSRPEIYFQGDQPAYYPQTDHIFMTPIEAFNNEQSYYTTLFHELVHSTGHRSRLARPGVTLGKLKSKLDYAFEELIAEMGAVFLSSESGILFKTLDNSAKYLRGWNSRLVKKMEEDNRFFFRASSNAQAAADFILDRDKEGKPAYLKAVKKTEAQPAPGTQLALLGENPGFVTHNDVKKLYTKLDKITSEIKKLPSATANLKHIPVSASKEAHSSRDQILIKDTGNNVKDQKGLKKPITEKRTEEMPASDHKSKARTSKLPGGFVVASEGPAQRINTFKLPKEFGKLLGDLQRYQLTILLTGDPHAGKSEFVTQLTNAFLDHGFKGAYFDLEQGGLISKDTQAAFNRNITKENQAKLAVTGEAPEGVDSVKAVADQFDFIVIDSFQELKAPVTAFNDLRKEYPNTIFVIIFQQTTSGTTRGGIKSVFDTPVQIKVYKVDNTFVNNYAQVEKNRGNQIGIQYNVSQKMVISENKEKDSEEDQVPGENSKMEKSRLIIY